jgi:hypothetical protein
MEAIRADAKAISTNRSLDHPFCLHCSTEDLLRYHSGRLAGNLMDSDQHQLYVWLLPHVSLGAGHPVRVQRWRLR